MLDPRMQIFNLTDRCDNACWFCICKRQIREGRGDSPSVIKSKLQAIRENGYIDIYGGEPTLSNFFMDIVRQAKRQSCFINIASNARRFSDNAFFEEFLVQTEEYQNNMFIRSSLHGHTAVLHDLHTRRKGSFDEAIGGIARLKQAGFRVSVNTVVTRLNCKYLSQIHNLINRHHVDVFKISFMRFTLQHARFSVTLNDLKAELPEVLDQVAQSEMTIDLDSIPYCVAPNHTALYAKEENRFIENEQRLVKPAKCSSCAMVGICPGVDREYFELLGPDELEPIAKRRRGSSLAASV